MSFEERFREEFKSDAETILEENLDRASGLFKYHEDGSIQLADEVHEAGGEIQVLVYLIARRMMHEANVTDSPSLTNEYFYNKLNVANSSVRNYIMRLRDDGIIISSDGEHQVVVENLPRAFDKIEGVIE
jgi:hypothetical protein